MKPKITLAFLLLLSIFSCKKDSNNYPLVGKWRTTEILYTAILTEPPYIQFSSAGKVQSTFFFYCTGYSVNGNDLTLKYTGSPSLTQVNYTYTIKGDTLTMRADTCSSNCNLTFVKE